MRSSFDLRVTCCGGGRAYCPRWRNSYTGDQRRSLPCRAWRRYFRSLDSCDTPQLAHLCRVADVLPSGLGAASVAGRADYVALLDLGPDHVHRAEAESTPHVEELRASLRDVIELQRAFLGAAVRAAQLGLVGGHGCQPRRSFGA